MNWLGTAKTQCLTPSTTAAASVLTSSRSHSGRSGRYQEFWRVVRISFMELAPTRALYAGPIHPYTKALLSAVPRPDPERIAPPPVVGETPDPAAPPGGCVFHPRCPLAVAACAAVEPPLIEQAPGHFARCARAGM